MLKDIAEQFNALEIYENRSLTDKYCELVFYSRDMDQWHRICTGIFDEAKKPAGVKPTKEDLSLAEKYGGIFIDQVLYKKDFDDSMIIAMFWPWQDTTHITLKIAVLDK